MRPAATSRRCLGADAAADGAAPGSLQAWVGRVYIGFVGLGRGLQGVARIRSWDSMTVLGFGALVVHKFHFVGLGWW